MRYILAGGLLLLILMPAVSFAAPEEKPVSKAEIPLDTTADDQKTLRTLGLAVDGPSLLDYFKKRTFAEADAKEMRLLVQRLGDQEFAIREKAYARLLDLGAGAFVGLKEAEQFKDPEVIRRADKLRQLMETKADPAFVQAASARLLARERPAGAAEVLLNYLPFAADQHVVDEVCKSLEAVVVADKVEPRVLEALTDKFPVKRAAAGAALARAKGKDQLPKVRKLLKDPDASVRLRIALALIPLKDKDILPVLVDCMGYLNPEQLVPAEEVLVRLAGDKTPAVSLGTTEATRKTCRAAWQAWLDKEGKSIDLNRLEEPHALLGYTLIVLQNQNLNLRAGGIRRPATGEVMEIDGAKKALWKFDVPTFPVDAQIVRVDGTERVLIAEYQRGWISERDFKGEVKWEQNVDGSPVGVQRLPNGNTFVVMQNRLLEIERNGKEAFVMNRPNHDVFRARKLRNGDVVFVTNNGQLTRIDGKSQKELAKFAVGQIPVLFGSIDVLADGGVIIPEIQRNRVVEYNAFGREVRTFNANAPNSVMRLPNGNILVGSQNTQRVAEFDRTGQEIWSHVLEGMPFNAIRR